MRCIKFWLAIWRRSAFQKFANLATLLQDLTVTEKQYLIELLKRIRESLLSHSKECIRYGAMEVTKLRTEN